MSGQILQEEAESWKSCIKVGYLPIAIYTMNLKISFWVFTIALGQLGLGCCYKEVSIQFQDMQQSSLTHLGACRLWCWAMANLGFEAMAHSLGGYSSERAPRLLFK